MCWVLVAAWGIFSCVIWTLSCGMWDLVPWPGIKPGPPALGEQSLNYLTTREVPQAQIVFLVDDPRQIDRGVGSEPGKGVNELVASLGIGMPSS